MNHRTIGYTIRFGVATLLLGLLSGCLTIGGREAVVYLTFNPDGSGSLRWVVQDILNDERPDDQEIQNEYSEIMERLGIHGATTNIQTQPTADGKFLSSMVVAGNFYSPLNLSGFFYGDFGSDENIDDVTPTVSCIRYPNSMQVTFHHFLKDNWKCYGQESSTLVWILPGDVIATNANEKKGPKMLLWDMTQEEPDDLYAVWKTPHVNREGM